MPELPEVETTRRGIAPYLEGKMIVGGVVRVAKLRLPLDPYLATILSGQTVRAVERRGKYLLLRCGEGTLILHLGMSGHLSLVPTDTPPGKHDHLDLLLASGRILRFTDPRRFGVVLWTADDPSCHPLLARQGVEPFGSEFSGEYLCRIAQGRSVAIKHIIMDSHLLVGVGNIYANEALFRAGIMPTTPAGGLGLPRCQLLATAIIQVLQDALALGGTTLRDFHDAVGRPGYFRLELNVYGRGGEPCRVCDAPIMSVRQGGRSTWFCVRCQR